MWLKILFQERKQLLGWRKNTLRKSPNCDLLHLHSGFNVFVDHTRRFEFTAKFRIKKWVHWRSWWNNNRWWIWWSYNRSFNNIWFNFYFNSINNHQFHQESMWNYNLPSWVTENFFEIEHKSRPVIKLYAPQIILLSYRETFCKQMRWLLRIRVRIILDGEFSSLFQISNLLKAFRW